ncbi:MAG: hypothetical protein E7Z84_05685 [Methanosphaera stadtmanae]|nr:hypothetical protein [Methanosphaera stadtmanae]
MKVSSKTLVFLMTLLILIITISAVSATDVNSNQTFQDDFTTQDMATTDDTNINQNTIIENEIGDQKANENKKDNKLKSNTYVINQSTYSDYFDSEGVLVNTVADGDTLDFQGLINLTESRIVINKSVNIVSTTHDANISLNTPIGDPYIKNSIPYDAFVIDRPASYTNITDINVYNTLIWVRADHVTFDRVNVTVDANGNLGFGTGHFTFRPGANYATVKNSNITTIGSKSSALVFTRVLYCTATNNTINSSGGSGNMIYLNFYNSFGDENSVINNATAQGIILNSYNNITNNTVIGPVNYDSATMGITITGSNNYIADNNITFSGEAIVSSSYADNGANLNHTVVNNNVMRNGRINLAVSPNSLCENNTVNEGTILIGYNSTVKGSVADQLTVSIVSGAVVFNNTVNQLNIYGNNTEVYNNTIGSVITYLDVNRVNPENITLHDNIINGNITNEKGVNVLIENNTINGNISIARTSRTVDTSNTVINNNTIHGQVTTNGESTTITNNSIFSEDTYAVVGGRYPSNMVVTNNLLISNKGELTGNDAVTNQTDITNENNSAKISLISITTEDTISSYYPTEIQIKVTDVNNQNLSVPVLVTVNDEEIGTVIGSDTLIYTPTISGNVTITATIVNSSEYYNQTTITREIISTTIDTNMIISIPEATKINKSVIINGTLLTQDNQTVPNVTIDYTFNELTEQTTTDNNGKFSVTITPEVSGTFNVIFNYAGNETFSASSKDVNLTVNKLNTNITLDDIESVKVGKNVTISGILADENNNPVSNVNIYVTVNNDDAKSVTTDNNGKFTYHYQTSVASNNNVTVVFNGDNYRNEDNKTTTFVTAKINTNINLDTINTVNQGENITISGSLVDEEGKLVQNADIKISINSVSNITTKTDSNGLFNASTNKVDPDNNDISVIYSGDQLYNSSEANASVIVKMYSIVTVDAVEGVALDNVTITAHVTDSKGNAVTGGNIAFKINNQILKDSADKQIRVPVVNGIATLSYQANAGWLYDNHPDITVQAIFTGTSRVQANRSEDNSVKIYKRNATVELNVNTTYVNSYLHLVATIKDHNGSNVDDGFLIFKLNGITLQDEDKHNIIGNVSDGVVELNCKLPFKFTAKVYTVDAIYSNKIYNKATGTAKMTVKAATVYINATVTLSNQFSNPKITGQVINKHTGEVIDGDIVVSVKFDGISYLKKVTVKNGILNLTITGIPIYKPGNHTVEIISGANSHFEVLRQKLSVKSTPKYDVVTKITNVNRTKNQTRVQATLVDIKNKSVQKDLRITIKVNGISFLTNYTVRNGKLDVIVNTSSLSNREYTLSITNGANTYYNANTNSTALPKYA